MFLFVFEYIKEFSIIEQSYVNIICQSNNARLKHFRKVIMKMYNYNYLRNILLYVIY